MEEEATSEVEETYSVDDNFEEKSSEARDSLPFQIAKDLDEEEKQGI